MCVPRSMHQRLRASRTAIRSLPARDISPDITSLYSFVTLVKLDNSTASMNPLAKFSHELAKTSVAFLKYTRISVLCIVTMFYVYTIIITIFIFLIFQISILLPDTFGDNKVKLPKLLRPFLSLAKRFKSPIRSIPL